MPADSVSVRVSHFKVVRCLGDVRSPGHSAALSTEAVRGLVSDQNTTLSSWTGQRSKYNAFLESSDSFYARVITLDFNHNTALDTAPPSVLKLPTD
jgi:hypothetical protein